MLYGGVQLGTLRAVEPLLGRVGSLVANLPICWALITLSLLWEFRIQKWVQHKFPWLRWSGSDNLDPVFTLGGILLAWVVFWWLGA